MSFMDKIKEFFSGSAGERDEHAGNDHAAHPHEPATPAPPMTTAEPTGMATPPPGAGTGSMRPDEPERRDDL